MRFVADRFFISDGGEVRGPFAKDQLRSMWSAGQITAATVYCPEGSEEWKEVTGLQLSGAATPLSKVETANVVETKGSGAGAVAIGSVLCLIGAVLVFVPSVAALGGLLLLAGFFTAVVGRMMS